MMITGVFQTQTLRHIFTLRKLGWEKRVRAVLGMYASVAIALQAQFPSVSFDGTDGANPTAGLVQATSGDFYGTTYSGGASGNGTVFRITPGGKLTTLYSFCYLSGCADGAAPSAGLIQGTDGDLYGTTSEGGIGGYGTIFKIILSGGKLTTLHTFEGTDGSTPRAGLVQAANGDFYGTTFAGGRHGEGTIFKINPGGTHFETLYNFCSEQGCADGAGPVGGLIQAADGDLYGTTEYGGVYDNDTCLPQAPGCGTVFKIAPGGTSPRVVYSFCAQSSADAPCTDGSDPVGGLVQATNLDFYGTTYSGGAVSLGGTCYGGCGTVFQITPAKPYTLTTLYTFCSLNDCADGGGPEQTLDQGTDGTLYGTTTIGGSGAAGRGATVFGIGTNGGSLTFLYGFCQDYPACPDGWEPGFEGGLMQATNGNFYGTTTGGANSSCGDPWGGTGCGTVFRFSIPGVGPFVEPQTTSGEVGAAVKILGGDLTGATSVTFNGTAAVFTVNASGSAITTTVPAGAASGPVQVVTASGSTLSSNVPFTVLP
jgi:uncharacterized repeat protein (TIGR03803 family)